MATECHNLLKTELTASPDLYISSILPLLRTHFKKTNQTVWSPIVHVHTSTHGHTTKTVPVHVMWCNLVSLVLQG